MDALEILREMHVEAKAGFQKIEQASPDQRGGLWNKLRPELVHHEQIEERFVYDPVAREIGSSDPTLSGWDQRHHGEVGEAEHLIEQLGGMEPRDDRWMQMVVQLRSALERHIQTEESEIWPRIRQVWGADKLEQAAGPMQQAKAA
jgi:hemerythrin-like domain-containing protein